MSDSTHVDEVTPAQRRYLAAFDRLLAAPRYSRAQARARMDTARAFVRVWDERQRCG